MANIKNLYRYGILITPDSKHDFIQMKLQILFNATVTFGKTVAGNPSMSKIIWTLCGELTISLLGLSPLAISCCRKSNFASR